MRVVTPLGGAILPIYSFSFSYSKENMLRPVRKLILHHPGKLTAWLVAFSSMYTFARVLVLQYTLGALHYWIYRYPSNFPHVVFVPLYYISVTGAFFAAIYHDCVVLQSGLWKYVLPIPLTVSGRLYRIVGVPVYAFAIAAIEAVQFFRNPSMESDLSRLAVYFQGLRDNVYLDDLLVKKVLFDIKWQAWTLQTATSPSTAAYIRLPLELLCAMIVCVIYGIAIFCNEPGQGALPCVLPSLACWMLFSCMPSCSSCRRRRAPPGHAEQRPDAREEHPRARREPEQQVGRRLDTAAHLRAAGAR